MIRPHGWRGISRTGTGCASPGRSDAVSRRPAAWYVGVKTGAIKPYQQERINVILDPENADRKGYGYHTWQSILTVGKGGITGSDSKGDASQSKLKFLPEPHTDFIFSVTAENIANGEVSPLVRAVASVLFDALRGVLKYL